MRKPSTADLAAAATRTTTGYRIDVTAASLIRDLALLVDKVDPSAVIDDMLITLLPGESVTFEVTSQAQVDPTAYLAPTVLRAANQLVAVGHQRSPRWRHAPTG